MKLKLTCMRLKLPLLRARFIPPARAPILRYGVAVLSITLALIPALMLVDVVESRLIVFAVAIMVSAWYGGWKPGLVATSFALTVSSYFSLAGAHTAAEYRLAIIHLALFVFVALLICWFNAALRAAQEGLRRSELNFRSLVTNAPYGICRCDSSGKVLDANPAFLGMLGYASAAELAGQHLGGLYADTHQWFDLADYLRSSAEFFTSSLRSSNRCRSMKLILMSVCTRPRRQHSRRKSAVQFFARRNSHLPRGLVQTS